MKEIILTTGPKDEMLRFNRFSEWGVDAYVSTGGFSGQEVIFWYENNYLARFTESLQKMASDMRGETSFGQEASVINFKLDRLGHLIVSGRLKPSPFVTFEFEFSSDFLSLEKLAKDFQALPPSITHSVIE
jgi:hypothetical protein